MPTLFHVYALLKRNRNFQDISSSLQDESFGSRHKYPPTSILLWTLLKHRYRNAHAINYETCRYFIWIKAEEKQLDYNARNLTLTYLYTRQAQDTNGVDRNVVRIAALGRCRGLKYFSVARGMGNISYRKLF